MIVALSQNFFTVTKTLINLANPTPPLAQPETITLPSSPGIDPAKELLRIRTRRQKKLLSRDRFLAEIDSIILWSKLQKLVELFYPRIEGAVRPPMGLVRMLRMYVAQQYFRLSDEGIEGAIHDRLPFAPSSASIWTANRRQ